MSEGDFQIETFLDDFVEEADDLLRQVTGRLLWLSQGGQPTPAVYDDLLRSFHTLKGLWGMVGQPQGAQLAHLLETVLNQVRNGQKALDRALLDVLLDNTQLMIRLVAGARGNEQPADMAERLAQLEEKLHGRPAGQIPEDIARLLSADEKEQVREAARLGIALFHSSAEQAAQGWSVARIREELEGAGRLLKAVPLIEGNRVRFAFLLDLRESHPLPEAPGLSWQLLPFPEEPAAAPAEQPPSPDIEVAPSRLGASVRVEVSRLDDIMRLVGDLVVSRWRLQTALDENVSARDGMARLERQLRELRGAVTRARLVRLSEVFGRMPLAVRDLARGSGREVHLHIQGEETQLDKVLVERLLDPLLHLVRNAIAHGLEEPVERERRGKPAAGNLWLSGRPEGDSIVVELRDDGRGLDLAAIARQAGVSEEALTSQTALDWICRPGFSTRDRLGLDAGRGVGMDVVRQAVAEMGGILDVDSTPGQGCTFRLRIPVTLAILDSFLIRLGDEMYAVARDAISEVLEVTPQSVSRFAQGELVRWRDGSLPLHRLRGMLGVSSEGPEVCHALVHARRAYAVDRVVGLREVVVRAVSDPLVAQPWLSGATELGDGSLALILDLSRLEVA